MSSVVPDGWSVYALGELGQVVGGGTPPSETLSYWGGSVMWATPAEITKLKSRYINKTLRTITKEGLQKSSAKLHPKGTILLTSRASIGYPAINSVPMATNQGFQSLRPNEKLDVEYGYQLILNNRNGLERLSAGSTFLEISSKEINKYKLPIPPLPEQKKIASILTSVDEVIENTQKQIDKLQDLKKATMNELLTKGIGHTEFKDSELGRIPKSWEVHFLDDVTKRGSGHTPAKQNPSYWNGGIKWVSLADSSRLDKGFIYETDKEISEEGLANSSAVLHPVGAVVLSRDAGVGKSGVLAEEMAVSQHFMAWHCENRTDGWFLYYWMQRAKPIFEAVAIGSTIKTIGLGYFKKLKMACPPFQEQKSIAKRLFSIDEHIDRLKDKLSQTQSLKKSLMQDLLTGKVRVMVN